MHYELKFLDQNTVPMHVAQRHWS